MKFSLLAEVEQKLYTVPITGFNIFQRSFWTFILVPAFIPVPAFIFPLWYSLKQVGSASYIIKDLFMA